MPWWKGREREKLHLPNQKKKRRYGEALSVEAFFCASSFSIYNP